MFRIQIHLDLFLSHGCLLVAVNGHHHGVLPTQNTDSKLLALLLSLLQPHTYYPDQHTLHFARLVQINTHCTLQDLPWSMRTALCKTYPDQHTLQFATYPDQHTLHFARLTLIHTIHFARLTYPEKHTLHFARLTLINTLHFVTYPDQYTLHFARLALTNIPCTSQDLPWPTHPAPGKTYPEQHAQYLATNLNTTPCAWQDLPWTTRPVLGKTYPGHAPCTWQDLPWTMHPALGKTYPGQCSLHLARQTELGAPYLTKPTLNTPSTWQDLPWRTRQYLARLTLTSSTSSALQRRMTTGSSSWYSPCQQQTMWACSAYMSNNSLLHNNKQCGHVQHTCPVTLFFTTTNNVGMFSIHVQSLSSSQQQRNKWKLPSSAFEHGSTSGGQSCGLAGSRLAVTGLAVTGLAVTRLAGTHWRLPMPHRTTVPPRAGSTVLPPLQRSKTGPQSPGHVLQFCPLFREARRRQWPHGATLQEQLWDNMEDLKTSALVQTTRLIVRGWTLLERRRKRRPKTLNLDRPQPETWN